MSSLIALAYHQIGEPAPGGWHTWYYVSEDRLRSHLAYLRDHSWEVIDAASLLRGLDDPASLPERAALLTFDDAYRSVVTSALPCLEEFGCPAVLFVPTDYVGDVNRFDEGSNQPEEAICSWDDLARLESAGVSIQSHGASHRSFNELAPEEIEEELARSKALLEQGLGTKVELFAYPYGEEGSDGDAVDGALARSGYRAAFSYEGGSLELPPPPPDRFRLPRIPLGADSDLAVELRGFD